MGCYNFSLLGVDDNGHTLLLHYRYKCHSQLRHRNASCPNILKCWRTTRRHLDVVLCSPGTILHWLCRYVSRYTHGLCIRKRRGITILKVILHHKFKYVKLTTLGCGPKSTRALIPQSMQFGLSSSLASLSIASVSARRKP